MKLKKLFVAAALALGLGVGAVAGISANANNAKAAEANATSLADLNGYKHVYRFRNTGGWSNVYAYHFTDDSHKVSAWPGTKLDVSYYDKDNNHVFVYATDADYDNIIFNNNGGSQTSDIAIESDTCWDASAGTWSPTSYTHYFYDRSGLYGATVYAHAYTSGEEINNGGWPGQAMSVVNYSGARAFSITLDECFDKIIFTNNNGRQSADGADGNAWANGKECFISWNGNNRAGEWSTLNSAMADAWIFQYMHFRDVMVGDNSDSGECYGTDGTDGYFAEAVDVYNNHLSDSVKAIITGYEDPTHATIEARLNAWAAACHKTAAFNVTDGKYSIGVSPSGLSLNGIHENNSNVSLIVVGSIVLVASALAGFFILRKKKQF